MNCAAADQDLKSKSSPGYCRRLLESMASLWKESAFCDVTIIVAKREFLAHKFVLAAASPFFKAMFSSGMEEEAQNEIHLHEIPPAIFQIIMSFIYSGCLMIDVDTCQDILAVADMLGLEDIVDICSEYIQANISTQNCVGIYAFADAHNFVSLKKHSELFIEKNFVEASRGDEFLQLDVKTVMSLLKSEHIYIERESQVLEAAVRWVLHDLPARRKYLLQVFDNVRFKLIGHKHLYEIMESCFDRCVKSVLAKAAMPTETWETINASGLYLPVQKPNMCAWSRQNAKKYIYVIGGFSRSKNSFLSSISTLDSVERYDFSSKTWLTLCNMNNPRSSHSFAVMDRKIVVAGGEDASLISDTVEVFDPDENVWTQLPNMHHPRYGLGLVNVHGRLYAIGGYVGTQIGDTVEMYDSEKKEWTIVDKMREPRFCLAVVEHEGLIYTAGGLSELCTESNITESYNPVTKEWCSLAKLRCPRAYHGLVAHEGYLYAVGGFNEYRGSLSSVERYSIKEDKWDNVAFMDISRAGAGVTIVDGKIYVFGGRSQDMELSGPSGFCSSRTLDCAECYDPTADRWNRIPNMAYERCETVAIVL